MKQFLIAHHVNFSDCVEKSELVKRVQETQAKLAASGGAAPQVRKCDCAQGSDHTHADPAAAASAAAAAAPAASGADGSGALIRQLAVGPLQCNMTIIADRATKEALLVDPGGDADKILALVKEMGVRVVMILVTHAHFDHFLAAEEVRKACGAPVALHPADQPLWAALPFQCAMMGIPAPKAPTAAPDRELSNGQELPVRGGRVLHTPGHSPGSCCFYFAADRLCCTGDTLFAGSVGRTDLMGGDGQALTRSIQNKLYALPPDTKCIPGHGASTTIGHEAKYNAVVRAKSSAL